MKKVLFLTTCLLLCITASSFAQTSKEARAARRGALKKEREAWQKRIDEQKAKEKK